ncbi:MAG: putative xylanase/chitin deacetylase [Verrucomicrobiaceae bacterium]|nr:putative xylanase/chitin deacetylase [Verrucomicrobiaceae bacterium]
MSHSLRIKNAVKAPLHFLADQLGPHRYSTRKNQLWVLMYHRILPVHDPRYRTEEPGMIVTPESFRQQLRIIKQLFAVMPLSEWTQRRASNQPLPARACAITFDDGWRDNFEFALPALQAEQLPATVFAVSDMIGTKQQFWPNRLSRLLALADIDRQALRSFDWLQAFTTYQTSGVHSREAIAALINECKRLSDPQLRTNLDAMEADTGLASLPEPSLMNWSEVRQMQATGLVEIGSHTCHHTRLVKGLPEKTLHAEIVDSRSKLEAQLEKPVTLFCYPNGDFSAAAAKLVSENYAAAVTTQSGINALPASTHQLHRIGIHEDVSNTPTRFRARLSGWI